MNKGTVKFYNETKGFGFITETETGTEYFVHTTGCVDAIADNDEVTFEIGEGKKGPMATDVRKA